MLDQVAPPSFSEFCASGTYTGPKPNMVKIFKKGIKSWVLKEVKLVFKSFTHIYVKKYIYIDVR